MSLSDDWRERHGQKQSDSRVFIYIVLLALILLLITRADDISRQFSQVFFSTSDSSSVDPAD